MNPLLREFEGALNAAGAPPVGAGVVVAVSGGRDSMVLLHALAALREARGWRLVVAHFHHGLRGAAADADAAFVRAAARGLGLRYVLGRVAVRRRRQRGESLEQAARRWRHAFLARTARRCGCGWVATGHHADDQAELFLLRLLRGAGAVGLGGMGVVDPSPADAGIRLVRPLLAFDGTWVENAAHGLGIAYREDATNRDPAFLRNRVRHELMPFLRERFQPGLGRVLVRAQTLLRDQAVWLAGIAEAWLGADSDGARRFDALPVALQREVLRVGLLRLGVEADFERIERLRGGAGVPIQVDARRRVVREDGGVVRLLGAAKAREAFSLAEKDVDLSGARGRVQFGGARFVWRIVATPVAPPREGECFDADVVGDRLRLRHWRAGDRFQPIGLPAATKLQDLFVNAKVPLAQRRGCVLAETATGSLFWVEGLRIGDAARLTSKTRRVLVWRWRRGA